MSDSGRAVTFGLREEAIDFSLYHRLGANRRGSKVMAFGDIEDLRTSNMEKPFALKHPKRLYVESIRFVGSKPTWCGYEFQVIDEVLARGQFRKDLGDPLPDVVRLNRRWITIPSETFFTIRLGFRRASAWSLVQLLGILVRPVVGVR